MRTRWFFPRDSLIKNRYRVLDLIGEGATSQVFKVWDVHAAHYARGASNAPTYSQRRDPAFLRALKAIREESDSGSPDTSLEAVHREAALLTNLSHPGLPKFYDLMRFQGHLCLVMDYIEGQNLKQLLDADGSVNLEIGTVLEWGVQISSILSYLHSQVPPIIYRDLKPSNLMLRKRDNKVVLIDFGIARTYKPGATSDTTVFGSKGYSPPEQYGHSRFQTDPRSDIYALGATLHHLLTGRDPSIVREPFSWPPLRDLNPLVPPGVDKIVLHCTELEMPDRPGNVEEVRSILLQELARLEEARQLPPELAVEHIRSDEPPSRSLPDLNLAPWLEPDETDSAEITIIIEENSLYPDAATVDTDDDARPDAPTNPLPKNGSPPSSLRGRLRSLFSLSRK